MTEEQIRLIIRDELQEFLASDRYIFHKNIQILDGRNIQVGTANGLKIGTETTQKIGFFGATPVDQPVAVDEPNNSADTYIKVEAQTVVTAVNDIRARLKELGLIA